GRLEQSRFCPALMLQLLQSFAPVYELEQATTNSLSLRASSLPLWVLSALILMSLSIRSLTRLLSLLALRPLTLATASPTHMPERRSFLHFSSVPTSCLICSTSPGERVTRLALGGCHVITTPTLSPGNAFSRSTLSSLNHSLCSIGGAKLSLPLYELK